VSLLLLLLLLALEIEGEVEVVGSAGSVVPPVLEPRRPRRRD